MTDDRSVAHRPLADYDLMDPKVQQCPYAFYASARAQAPSSLPVKEGRQRRCARHRSARA
jgi:hypothetical protein